MENKMTSIEIVDCSLSSFKSVIENNMVLNQQTFVQNNLPSCYITNTGVPVQFCPFYTFKGFCLNIGCRSAHISRLDLESIRNQGELCENAIRAILAICADFIALDPHYFTKICHPSTCRVGVCRMWHINIDQEIRRRKDELEAMILKYRTTSRYFAQGQPAPPGSVSSNDRNPDASSKCELPKNERSKRHLEEEKSQSSPKKPTISNAQDIDERIITKNPAPKSSSSSKSCDGHEIEVIMIDDEPEQKHPESPEKIISDASPSDLGIRLKKSEENNDFLRKENVKLKETIKKFGEDSEISNQVEKERDSLKIEKSRLNRKINDLESVSDHQKRLIRDLNRERKGKNCEIERLEKLLADLKDSSERNFRELVESRKNQSILRQEFEEQVKSQRETITGELSVDIKVREDIFIERLEKLVKQNKLLWSSLLDNKPDMVLKDPPPNLTKVLKMKSDEIENLRSENQKLKYQVRSLTKKS